MSKVSKTLFKGSAFQTLSFFAQVIVVFFLMPFIVKTLGDRLYGLWTLVGAVIGYYGLLDFGMSLTVNRHIAAAIGADDKEESNYIFNSAFFLFSGIGIIALLVTVLLTILTPYLFENPSDASLFAKVILVVGVYLAIEFPVRVYQGALAAKMRYDIIANIQMLTLALRTALTVLILVLGLKVLALAWVTVTSGIPGMILFVYYSKKNMPHLKLQWSQYSADRTKKIFTYSFFAFISNLAEMLRHNIDVVVISVFLGLATVTHYKIASTMVQYFRKLVVTVLGVYFPLFGQLHGAQDSEGLKASFFFSSKLATCIAGFIGFGFVAWGHPFIERWMGPEYLDAFPVLFILTVASTLSIAQSSSPAVLFVTSNHRLYSMYGLADGALNLILSLLLVKPFGMVGVAMGTLIPLMGVKLVIQPLHVCKVMSIRYSEYAGRMLKTVLRVAVALIIPTLISVTYVAPNYRNLFVISLLSAGAYVVVIWYIELNRDEKLVFIRTVTPRLMLRKAVD